MTEEEKESVISGDGILIENEGFTHTPEHQPQQTEDNHLLDEPVPEWKLPRNRGTRGRGDKRNAWMADRALAVLMAHPMKPGIESVSSNYNGGMGSASMVQSAVPYMELDSIEEVDQEGQMVRKEIVVKLPDMGTDKHSPAEGSSRQQQKPRGGREVLRLRSGEEECQTPSLGPTPWGEEQTVRRDSVSTGISRPVVRLPSPPIEIRLVPSGGSSIRPGVLRNEDMGGPASRAPDAEDRVQWQPASPTSRVVQHNKPDNRETSASPKEPPRSPPKSSEEKRKGTKLTAQRKAGIPLLSQPSSSLFQAGNTMVQPFSSSFSSRSSLTLKLFGLPKNITVQGIYLLFKDVGAIDLIDIFENSDKDPRALIRFKPPPLRDVHNRTFAMADLNDRVYTIQARADSATLPRGDWSGSARSDSRSHARAPHKIQSPVQEGIWYERYLDLDIASLEFGVLQDEASMMPLMELVHGRDRESVSFTLDVHKKHIDIQFRALPVFKFGPSRQEGGHVNRHYRFQIRFTQLSKLIEVNQNNQISLVIPLEDPPLFYKKLFNVIPTLTSASGTWREWDSWWRQTDIIDERFEADLREFRARPINLQKPTALVNLGRWTIYRLVLSDTFRNRRDFGTLRQILSDFNVPVVPGPGFKILCDPHPPVWDLIDRPADESQLHDLYGHHVSMPFEIRYLLEACISQGKLNEYSMTQDFVDQLLELDKSKVVDILDHVANEKTSYFDPMKIFKVMVFHGASTRVSVPSYCCMIKSAKITPTRIYYSTASVEVSNRVIRRYREYADRFLRVRFTDELSRGDIYAARDQTDNMVFTRVWHAMINGIMIGDRHYEFLAFGNSQFRERGAYFFAPLDHLTASNIRAWMGEFNHIRVIAKYAARLGQCFSTTWAVTSPNLDFKTIPDIERQGPDGKNHIFTDGVGKISPFLARLATSELRGLRRALEPPSVFQFRLGGYKGILAIDPTLGQNEVHLRPSQAKFESTSKRLEIIRWSQYAPAHLNRQIILVLSSLGVEDEIFMQKMKDNLTTLDQAMSDSVVAFRELQRVIDPNQQTIEIATMVNDGFHDAREPFVTSLLQLWRAWRVKSIKEKANIAIQKSALLLGCIDETATLTGHLNEDCLPGPRAQAQEKVNSLPEIFVQVSSSEIPGTYEIIQGVCLLARNPSLHPGDIRVVKAVNNLSLYHLKDVIVFPQTGDQDLPGMCSGGDLDGDDFLVVWDCDLTPIEWNHPPMDYAAPEPLTSEGNVTIRDITSFFVQYMKNNRLPTIAHAHLAWADRLDEGVRSQKCIGLATLHSKAVDYNKTGIEAVMEKGQYPNLWPHFMEKKHKPASQIYHSKKILGQLYDCVQRLDFSPNYSAPFDKRILDAINPDNQLIEFAKKLKAEYDASMYQIMAQYEVKTEFEIFSTFLLDWKWGGTEYKMHELTGRLAMSLKDQYRQACYDHVGGRDFHRLAPLAVAMYKVTQDEMSAALAQCNQAHEVDGQLVPLRTKDPKSMPLMSFPWIFPNVLGKIVSGYYDLHKQPGTELAKDNEEVKSSDLQNIERRQIGQTGIQPQAQQVNSAEPVFTEAGNDGASVSSTLDTSHVQDETSLLDSPIDDRFLSSLALHAPIFGTPANYENVSIVPPMGSMTPEANFDPEPPLPGDFGAANAGQKVDSDRTGEHPLMESSVSPNTTQGSLAVLQELEALEFLELKETKSDHAKGENVLEEPFDGNAELFPDTGPSPMDIFLKMHKNNDDEKE